MFGFFQRLSLVERTLYVSYTVPAQYQVQYTADKMSVQTLRQIVSAPQLWSICSLLFLHLKVQNGFVLFACIDATTGDKDSSSFSHSPVHLSHPWHKRLSPWDSSPQNQLKECRNKTFPSREDPGGVLGPEGAVPKT